MKIPNFKNKIIKCNKMNHNEFFFGLNSKIKK